MKRSWPASCSTLALYHRTVVANTTDGDCWQQIPTVALCWQPRVVWRQNLKGGHNNIHLPKVVGDIEFTLSICLSVCLFGMHFLRNYRTDLAQFLHRVEGLTWHCVSHFGSKVTCFSLADTVTNTITNEQLNTTTPPKTILHRYRGLY